jgi:tetratricopeptide (TPR) repeat protein
MTQFYGCEQGHEWTLPQQATPESDGGFVLCPTCGHPGRVRSTPAEPADRPASPPTSQPVTTPSATEPERRFIADYEILGELGQGELGVVYRAYSPRLGRVVALKTLRQIDPDRLNRLKREFRALSDVSHPNLVTLYELVAEGDTCFFSMELIEGVDFLRYVRYGVGNEASEGTAADADSLTPLRLIRLRWSLAQLASAVVALHGAKVLHRDIKPSNILVTAEERLVLLDFGLAAELSGEEAGIDSDGGVVGTVAYMSPEQGSGGVVTEASDWYAVGAVVYEALTGQLPFSGKPLKVMHRKREHDPPPPRTLVDSVPDDLNRFCMDLMHRDPKARPAARQIEQRLAMTGSSIWAHGIAAFRGADKTLFVGRDRHLTAIDQCYAQTEGGRTAVLFVHGNSGMGKTSLVQEALKRLRRRRNAVVLTGRCYQQESVPFKALDSLIDALGDYLRRLPEEEAADLMPREVPALLQVFPVLGRVEAIGDAAQRSSAVTDPDELRRRASAALRELVTRIGKQRLLVLFVDDLQWGDVDSALMLCELLRPPDSPLLLFIGAYREEDAQTSVFLKSFHETEQRALQRLPLRHLAVGPLGDAESQRLAELLLEQGPPGAAQCAQTVARESGGSPFFARELTHYLRSAGGRTPPPMDLEAMLVARLGALPPPAQRLLETLAVAGRPTSQDEILAASGLPAEGAVHVARLKAEHLIRVTGTDREPLLETFHDRIREAATGQIETLRLRQIHRRLADVILAALQVPFDDLAREALGGGSANGSLSGVSISPRDWQRMFDLANHYSAADEHDRALVFALLAAEQARRQHSLDIAERQYQIASQASDKADAATRYRIARGLGEIRMRQGNYRAARQTLEGARHLAQGEPPLVTAEIEGVLGELAFKQGDMLSASRAIERGLSQLGFRVPRRWITYAALVLWEIGVQTLHTWFPRQLVGRQALDDAQRRLSLRERTSFRGAKDDKTPVSSLDGRQALDNVQRDLLAVRLYSRLARVFWFSRGTIKKFWAHLRELNLVERYTPTLELAQAYSNHAAAMSLIPWFRRASRYAHRSFEIREQFGDLWGQAQTQHFHGVALYAASRFGECIEICREAIRLFDRTGDFWELNMARYQLAASFYGLGDLAAASQEAWKMHASGLELGDIQASGLSICLVSKATCGRVPQEIVQAELDRPRGADSQTTSQVWQAEGLRRLANDDFVAAAEAFQRGWDIARRGGICNTYVVTCLPGLAGALRREAARIRPTDAAACRRLLRRARRAVRRGLRLARRFQNDLPLCLREAGLVAAAQGRRRTARRYFQQSLQVADSQGARYEHAQTSLALAELDRQLGKPGADQRIAAAEAAIADIERPVKGSSRVG